jgi:GT2 family glycosyltransferase
MWFKIERLLQKFINTYRAEGVKAALVRTVKKVLKVSKSKLGANNLAVASARESLNLDSRDRYKKLLLEQYKCKLEALLNSDRVLEFSTFQPPLVSIILVLYNKAELTLECLNSLLRSEGIEKCEIIIIDNNSQDKTNKLLEKLRGVTIIKNSVNRHFLLASNQAANLAKGEYILFLNNDTHILPDAINNALKTFKDSQDVGAVGGKIILLDGNLQEAGSIIWQDGSCLGYGRGDDPFSPLYMFPREVDYCSGAFLLTPRHLFLECGGFDEQYQPAYYEEADYCMQLWAKGKMVIYDPKVIIFHFEFASSSSSEKAIELQIANQQKFIIKHQKQLGRHLPPHPDKIIWARQVRRENCQRVLFIEDRIPYSYLGSGFPRTQEIITALLENSYFITYYPLQQIEDHWDAISTVIPNSVEVMINHGVPKFQDFLEERQNYYEVIIVSRPHNMKVLKPILTKYPEWFKNTKVIYDAEALYSSREILRKEVQKDKNGIVSWYLEEELDLLKAGDCIISVSEGERRKLEQHGAKNVEILSHCLDLEPTPNTFADRENILFVGSIHTEDSPNADSTIWFIENIFPLIKQQLPNPVKLLLVGLNNTTRITELAQKDQDIELVGQVDNPREYYNQARIFIAPTRFAAGIPLKVLHAAAEGIPSVVTSILASQIDWYNEEEVLIADTAETFAAQCVRLYTQAPLWEKLRLQALARIKQEYAPEKFRENLQKILTKISVR